MNKKFINLINLFLVSIISVNIIGCSSELNSQTDKIPTVLTPSNSVAVNPKNTTIPEITNVSEVTAMPIIKESKTISLLEKVGSRYEKGESDFRREMTEIYGTKEVIYYYEYKYIITQDDNLSTDIYNYDLDGDGNIDCLHVSVIDADSDNFSATLNLKVNDDLESFKYDIEHFEGFTLSVVDLDESTTGMDIIVKTMPMPGGPVVYIFRYHNEKVYYFGECSSWWGLDEFYYDGQSHIFYVSEGKENLPYSWLYVYDTSKVTMEEYYETIEDFEANCMKLEYYDLLRARIVNEEEGLYADLLGDGDPLLIEFDSESAVDMFPEMDEDSKIFNNPTTFRIRVNDADYEYSSATNRSVRLFYIDLDKSTTVSNLILLVQDGLPDLKNYKVIILEYDGESIFEVASFNSGVSQIYFDGIGTLYYLDFIFGELYPLNIFDLNGKVVVKNKLNN